MRCTTPKHYSLKTTLILIFLIALTLLMVTSCDIFALQKDNTNDDMFVFSLSETGYELTRVNYDYAFSTETIKIPSEYNGLPVTIIGDSAFMDCSSIISVEIPDSVISIGENAFSDCSSLTSINIPEGITSIKSGVFSGCSALSSINIPDKVTEIGENAFHNCSSLSSINIPTSIKSIAGDAFSGCASLKEIIIPDSATITGVINFSGCSNLETLLMNGIADDDLMLIRFWNFTPFEDCVKLSKIRLPQELSNIGDYAFSGCSSLPNIDIPDSVSWIGEKAFLNCSSLTDINIPGSIGSIAKAAFQGCTITIKINREEIPSSWNKNDWLSGAKATVINSNDEIVMQT